MRVAGQNHLTLRSEDTETVYGAQQKVWLRQTHPGERAPRERQCTVRSIRAPGALKPSRTVRPSRRKDLLLF
eukprot:4000446-Pyramimonas_sp.AAC.1